MHAFEDQSFFFTWLLLFCVLPLPILHLFIRLFRNFLFPPQPLPASPTLCLPPSSSLHPTGTVDQRVLGDKYPGPRAHQPPIPATLLCHIVAEASLKRH